MFQKMTTTIKGKTALLMNRFPLEAIEGLNKKTPEAQAEIAAYRDKETGELFVPGVNIQRCLVRGATYSKGKGRASLQKQAAACLMVWPEKCLLGIKHYELDARGVVIAATKGRIVRYRPRLNDWQVSFEIEYDDALLSEKELRTIVDNSGLRVGIGDFRPERGGWFGRFSVVKWDSSSK